MAHGRILQVPQNWQKSFKSVHVLRDSYYSKAFCSEQVLKK